MTDVEIVNGFFSRESFDENETILKQKCIEIKRGVDSLVDEIKAKKQEAAEKEEQFKALSAQFNALIQLALEQEKARLARLG